MTKNEFIQALNRNLKQLSSTERADIVSDFEEHFTMGLAEGKTEEEIASSLGSPNQIAKEMLANHHLGNVKQHPTPGNVLRATWAVIGLSFFNLVFVLGPFIALIGVIIAGWTASASFTLSPLMAIGDAVLFSGSSFFEFFLSLILCGVGLLLGIAMLKLTKWLMNGFIRYLKFNTSLVKGGMKHEKK